LTKITNHTEVTIIGGGPGGLSAAYELVNQGISVSLIDENSMLGGQFLRQLTPEFIKNKKSFLDINIKEYNQLLNLINNPYFIYINNSIVWNILDEMVVVYVQNNQTKLISSNYIIVASGAYDRAVPFPGWTLPGVMTVGGVLNLLKSQLILPGKNIIVSGNGALILLIANYLNYAGANILEVLESSNHKLNLVDIIKLFYVPSLFKKGIAFRLNLMLSGIPYKTGEIIVEAKGDKIVEEVIIAPINSEGKTDLSRSRTVITDILITGFGLTSSSEITQFIGCEHNYNALKGGWIPIRTKCFETTIKNVFSVGDCAGIKGSDIASCEGRIAGITALNRIKNNFSINKNKLNHFQNKLKKYNNFQNIINKIYLPPNNYLSLINKNTIICRCEDVTYGDLLTYLDQNIYDIRSLKSVSRAGMGKCQGRNCLGTIISILEQNNCSHVFDNNPNYRPPLKPVLISDLIEKEFKVID